MRTKAAVDPNLKKLMDGNRRYVGARMKHPRQGPRRRKEVAKGQQPFAIIVGCSDSRIPPEVIFDQGLGDLFIIRVAGNVVDDIAMGSIEYAADHLGVELVVVLGHGACGAVTATAKGGAAHGHVADIVRMIAPAVAEAKKLPGDLVDNAIRANVGLVVQQIVTSKPVMAGLVKKGLKVVGAYYDIDTGKVETL